MASLLRNTFTLRRSLLAAEVYNRVIMGESSHFCYFCSTAPKNDTKKPTKKTKSNVSEFNAIHKKDLALQEALGQITASFGEGSIMWLGRSTGPKAVPVISTGSLTLDIALGIGGFPKGRVVEIFGAEASGKTTLALHAIAESQKLGGNCVFIDAEHALDPVLAESIGVKTENLLLSQPDSGEQALSLVDTLIRSGSIDVVVVDSVAALVPKSELEGEMGDAHMAMQARLMSQALRKLSHSISHTQTLLIFINQVRSTISTFGYAPTEVTCGGNALKFYASVRLSLKRIGNVIKGGKPENVIGSKVQAKVIKNKLAPPFKTANFEIEFGKGISREAEIIELATKFKFIKTSGLCYHINDNALSGIEAAKRFLQENEASCKEIVTRILDKFEIRSECDNVDEEADTNEEEKVEVEEELSVVEG